MTVLKALMLLWMEYWLGSMSPGQREWQLDQIAGWVRQRSPNQPQSLEEEFRRLGNRLGVHSYAVSGTLGLFEGSFKDASIQASYLASGTWEPLLQSILADGIFLEGKGTFVDVGANIGLITVPLAKKRGIHCIAMEPEPQNFFLLRKNIMNNGMEDLVKPMNIALFSKDEGTLDFELSNHNLGDHRVRIQTATQSGIEGLAESQRAVIKVSAARLDSVLNPEQLQRPIVVKLDTQGSEVQIIRGGQKFLMYADFLVCEFGPYWLRRMGDSPEALIECLGALGFPFGIVLRDAEAGGNELESVSSLTPIESLIRDLVQFLERDSGRDYIDIMLARQANIRPVGASG